MAKVQFNCRLEEAVRDRIVEVARVAGKSQADVIGWAIAALDMQAAQGRPIALPPVATVAPNVTMSVAVKPRAGQMTCEHGKASGYHCGMCGGLAKV